MKSFEPTYEGPRTRYVQPLDLYLSRSGRCLPSFVPTRNSVELDDIFFVVAEPLLPMRIAPVFEVQTIEVSNTQKQNSPEIHVTMGLHSTLSVLLNMESILTRSVSSLPRPVRALLHQQEDMRAEAAM